MGYYNNEDFINYQNAFRKGYNYVYTEVKKKIEKHQLLTLMTQSLLVIITDFNMVNTVK